MTLLEQAKKVEEREPEYALSKEAIEQAELMIAWVMGEISNKQVGTVMKFSHHNSAGTKVGPALREVAKFGRLSIKILPEKRA